MENKPANTADIAKLAGVSKMTVSRTLRFPHMVSAHTREKVEAVIRKLNYRPDPFTAVFTSRLRRGRHPKSTACIGLLCFGVDHESLEMPFYRDLLAGTRQTSNALGYELLVITDRELMKTKRETTQMLKARGVLGLVVAPLDVPKGKLPLLDWDQFAAVALGYSLEEPAIHRVCTNHSGSMVTAVQTLLDRGFQRIGCCLVKKTDRRMNQLWQGAFYTQATLFPTRDRIPIFLDEEKGAEAFSRWFDRHQPEAIIGSSKRFFDWLTASGRRVPQDLEYVGLGLHESPGWNAEGVAVDATELGVAAVELLTTQFHHAQYGIPPRPRTLLVDPRWQKRR